MIRRERRDEGGKGQGENREPGWMGREREWAAVCGGSGWGRVMMGGGRDWMGLGEG